MFILSRVIFSVSKVSKISQIMSFENFREERDDNLNMGVIMKDCKKKNLLTFLTTERSIFGIQLFMNIIGDLDRL
jgi:hypothetical protein